MFARQTALATKCASFQQHLLGTAPYARTQELKTINCKLAQATEQGYNCP